MNAIVLVRPARTPLDRVLLRRACEWAETVAPGRWTTADAVPDRLDAPVVITGVDVPRLGPAHAAVAQLDLDEGTDMSFGPTFAGGLYLVAMRDPRPDLVPEDWRSPTAFTEGVRRAHEAGLEVGWLRMERAVGTPADRAALRVDPLVAPEVRSVL